MSDLNDKIKTRSIIRKVYPAYEDGDMLFSERPDIHIRKYGAGVEVTRAFSHQEGIFHSHLRGKIRNPKALLTDYLSTGHACLIEDTSTIVHRVTTSILKKARMAKGYKAEKPWLRHLGLAVIVGYDLELCDLESAIDDLSNEDKIMFDELYLLTPSKSFYFDGWSYALVEDESRTMQ